MPPRFSKVGSLELIFWLETGVSGTNFWLHFVSQELNFIQNLQKLGWKCNFFFQNIEVGSLKLEKGLKCYGGSQEQKMAWKGGSWGWHIPILPSNVSASPPPPGTRPPPPSCGFFDVTLTAGPISHRSLWVLPPPPALDLHRHRFGSLM